MDKIKELLKAPIDNTNPTLIIFLFVTALLLSAAILFLLIKSLIACIKYNKSNKYKFVNIPNIICFSIVVTYYYYKDYVNSTIQNKIPILLIYILTAILVLIPLIRNLLNCKFIYALQYTIWQVALSLFCISVVYAIMALFILAAAFFLGASSATDTKRIRLASTTGEIVYATEISAYQLIDDSGNHYYKSGDYFYSDNNNDCNHYWITE